MRLIDADALNKVLQEKLGSPTDDKLYEVNLSIIEAPTIDAISVEWLKERMNRALDSAVLMGDRSEDNVAKSIWNVLTVWKRRER